MDSYGDIHRGTLQLMMNYGTLDSVEFVKIFEQLISNLETQISADDVISAINSKISQFDQKITKYTYDLTNEVFYIFHATAETSMSKIQHSYNASEVEYFKNLFIKITEDDHVRISPLDALNLSGKLLSKVRAQRLLENWTQEAYFQQIDGEDYFYIGPKLLIEFKDLMISLELSHIKCCLLCESIAIWGDRCQNCSTLFHQTCIQKFISRSDKCPSCKEKWQRAEADN